MFPWFIRPICSGCFGDGPMKFVALLQGWRRLPGAYYCPLCSTHIVCTACGKGPPLFRFAKDWQPQPIPGKGTTWYCNRHRPGTTSQADDSGAASVKTLVTALSDPDVQVRRSAIGSLRLLGNTRAVEPLVKVLETDAETAYDAINALGDLRDPRSVEALVSYLNKRNGDYLGVAAFQLGEIGRTVVGSLWLQEHGGVEALISLLKDGSEYERCQAAIALGKSRDDRAIESLKLAVQERNENVRQKAAEALRALGVQVPRSGPVW